MVDPTLSTRQLLEQHRADPKCSGCHTLFDPLGMALEHFDPIGKYRDTDNGVAIDASGMKGTVSFNGGAELGAMLRQTPVVLSCLVRNFYRQANGRAEDANDMAQIAILADALAARNYSWSGFLADFVASEAFRSAPALPITTGSM
jgi:hypothetical protein